METKRNIHAWEKEVRIKGPGGHTGKKRGLVSREDKLDLSRSKIGKAMAEE